MAVTTATRPRVALRASRPDDVPFLRRVYAETRREELAPVPWTEDQRDAFLRQQFDAQDAYYREHYDGATFDVIEVAGEPAGRLYAARWDDEIRVMDIALLPEFRGAGIGTALLGDLLDEAAESGRSVSIHVERNNPALRLYERLGFSYAGEHGIYLLLRAEPDGRETT